LVSVLPDRDGARVGRFAPRPPPRGCRYGAPSGRVRHREILDTSTPWRGYKRPRSDDGSQPPESSSSAPSGTASASRSASQPSGNATRPGELVRPRGCPSTSSGYGASASSLPSRSSSSARDDAIASARRKEDPTGNPF